MEYEEARQILDSYNALCRALKLPPNAPGEKVKAKAQRIMDEITKTRDRNAFLEDEITKTRARSALLEKELERYL